jgi:hypothetical protein
MEIGKYAKAAPCSMLYALCDKMAESSIERAEKHKEISENNA